MPHWLFVTLILLTTLLAGSLIVPTITWFQTRSISKAKAMWISYIDYLGFTLAVGAVGVFFAWISS
jgi:hypothetical protein